MSQDSRIGRSHRLRIGRRSLVHQIYMVTTVTRDRTRTFSDWDRACACARVLHRMSLDVPVASLAWVLMPDHIHWLLCLEGGTLGGTMKQFKAYSARQVNAVAGCKGSIWQPGYHDHAVRREEDLRDLARYIIANPVRADLCRRVGDYPFWDAVWVAGNAGSDGSDDLISAD